MKLLILGGTTFLGRALTDASLEKGHDVALFNRGRTNPELYPDGERLRGDRGRDLSALDGREWDAVIDTSGYVPHLVRASCAALAASGCYCFVSSISVYDDFSRPLDEKSALASLGDDPIDELTESFSNCGSLKALCEQAVSETFGDRTLVIRPGLIVGPYDPTGRFTYWPHRVARGGEVLAPAPPDRTVQFIDVRDLAEWMLDLCEREADGIFNATNTGLPWSELLESCRRVTEADCELVWVPDEFLVEQEVPEWMGLPMWIADPAMAGANEAVVDRALVAGLRFRPPDDTVRGAYENASTTDEAGLSPEREAELIAAWHGR